MLLKGVVLLLLPLHLCPTTQFEWLKAHCQLQKLNSRILLTFVLQNQFSGVCSNTVIDNGVLQGTSERSGKNMWPRLVGKGKNY